MRPIYREEPAKQALTRLPPQSRMSFHWSLNPYMGCVHQCTFCYVRSFEQRADRPADARYGASIRVKTNIAELLAHEVGKRTWKREPVGIGSATDPYQPAEGQYRLTRQCLAILGRARTPFSIVTRGPLIVRDIDVLRDASERAEVTVNVSIPTFNHTVWRQTEPGTAPPEQRMRAVRLLVDAGIKAGVGMAPILPGLTDSPQDMLEVVRAAREAGATHLWARLLYLPPGTREHFLHELDRAWPEEAARYAQMYARGAYAAREHSTALTAQVEAMKDRLAIADRRPRPLVPPPAPHQLAMFEAAM